MKRIISLLLMLAMLLSMVAVTVTAVADEPVTLYCVTGKHAGGIPASRDDDFVYTTILDRTGVAVILDDLQDYENALGNRISANDIPDLMYVEPDMAQSLASQGLLRDLSDMKETETWQHILATYGEDIDIPSNYYGDEMICIPAAMALGDYYYEIYTRADWNEKYGLKNPTTIDELYDYCKWIMENDPDGNGIADTVGFTCWGLTGLCAITAPYDVAFGNYLLIRDGKVTNTLLQPRMLEALETVKKFYTEGLIDPGMFSNSESKATTVSGKVGVVAMPWSNMDKAKYTKDYKQVTPEAQYLPIEAFDAGEGPRYTLAKHDIYVGQKMVVNADLSDEKFEALLKVLDYMTTEEGEMLVYMGLEGRHWQRNEAGEISAIAENATETNYTHEYQWMGRNDARYLALKFPEAAHSVEWGLRYNPLEYFNSSVVIDPDEYDLLTMEDYVKTQLIAFFKGDRPLSADEYAKFLDELYNIYDFQTYMDIATKQLVDLGLATE
jgi:putative aldouronate transport system substrate-binding protein